MFRNYFKTAYRNLLRNKGFTFINVAGLTLGLTACLLISLFVWDEQQFDKFIPEGEQVYRVYQERTTAEAIELTPRTPPMYGPAFLQELPEVVESVRVMEILSKNLFEANNKKIYEEKGVYVDSNFFKIFPLRLKWGTQASALKEPASIVISEQFAQRYFGTENPVGKEVLMEKQPLQVKGVFQHNPKFHLALDYILPMSAAQLPAERMESWGWHQFNTYVRVKRGTDAQALEAKFKKVLDLRNPPDPSVGVHEFRPLLQALEDVHLYSADFKYDMAVRGNITYVRALSIIAFFILAIACFNFVNLATAKSLKRAKEVGVRKTIGASRQQLMVQFIIETILLTGVSILLAVGFVALLLPWLNKFADKQISLSLLINPLVLLLLLALALFVGVTAGFYPALVLSGFQPVKVLKGTAASEARPGQIPWLRHSLVVVQFALSILLIISAVVVFRQVSYLNSKDLGFNKEQIMFFPMRGTNMFENYSTFKNELQRVPGVSSVSIGYGFPGDMVAGDQVIVPNGGEQTVYPVTQLLIDHDYIKTLGLELVAGRDFSKEMKTDPDKAFIINETAVRELGLGSAEKALGQPLHWGEWGANHPDSLKKGQVIGVVKDFHYKSLFDRVEPAVLQIYPGAYWKVAVKIETASASDAIAGVKGVWQQFSPDYPLEYNFLDESFGKMYKAEDKLKTLLWIFTGLAIFIGCLGLFGLAAYAAERRIKEIGIRKVLGASEQNIVMLLSGDFVKLVLISILIASPIAWYFMQQWLQDFAYRINISWWIFALAGLAAVTIALATVSFHAIKAALRNPVRNLRIE
ncbi:ABC transporter permease [Cesiribacter sp. SM1]|uniref:ABC transporter permease n=1 Tax=Cesiribacter sp. SM1 TaxID=2861196 RepID=UPI001CD19C22|nr:ABC transporter permease [Cesiribacter sp. SM1]